MFSGVCDEAKRENVDLVVASLYIVPVQPYIIYKNHSLVVNKVWRVNVVDVVMWGVNMVFLMR